MSDSICNYVENSCEPCEECPRSMMSLHRCGFLLETYEETKELIKDQEGEK